MIGGYQFMEEQGFFPGNLELLTKLSWEIWPYEEFFASLRGHCSPFFVRNVTTSFLSIVAWNWHVSVVADWCRWGSGASHRGCAYSKLDWTSSKQKQHTCNWTENKDQFNGYLLTSLKIMYAVEVVHIQILNHGSVACLWCENGVADHYSVLSMLESLQRYRPAEPCGYIALVNQIIRLLRLHKLG